MRLLAAILISLSLLLSPPAQAADGHRILFDPKTEWLNVTRPLTADDAKGRMVLLDFWTYGCINCMHIIPDLKKLEEEFGDRLLVIGVHSAKFSGEKGSARIVAAAERFGLAHPLVNDKEFDIWEQFDVRAWPTLVLLDGTGAEAARYAGEGHYHELRKDIAKGIAGLKQTTELKGIVAEKKDTGALNFPARLGFAKDTPWGQLLFVADGGHHRLLGMTRAGEVKVTIGSGKQGNADGAFHEASFHNPRGFAVVSGGIYVADTENHLIRFVDFAKKSVTTVAGTGKQGWDRDASNAPALKTDISSPWDVKMLPDGKTLAIAMAGTHQLWTLDTNAKTLSVLAGTGKESIDNGDALKSSLSQPSGLAVSGDTLYFVDAETSSLRQLKSGQVSTLVGTGLFDFGLVDGAYPKARMQHAQGLSVDGARIVLADTYNNALRVYDTATGLLSTVRLQGELLEPGDVLPLDGMIYVADTNHHRIVAVDEKTGAVTEVPLRLTSSRPD